MNVIEHPRVNRQVAIDMLRALADDIESGASEDMRQAVLVVERDSTPTTWQVYEFGVARGDALRAVGVLHVGIQSLMDRLLGA